MTSPPGSGSATGSGTLSGAARSSSPAGVGSAERSPLSHSSHSPARATASGTRYAPRQTEPLVRALGASGSESTRDTSPPTCAHSTGSPSGCATPTAHRPRTRRRPVSAPEGSHSTASSVRPSRIEAGIDSVTAADGPRRIGGSGKALLYAGG